ncbi:MAG: DUF6655 family protein [Kiloniellaceae bacterium]
MTVARAPAAVLLLLALCACSELRESQPGRTATEQLLFSAAVDRVCDQLALQIPAQSKVFVDAAYVEGTDSKYLVATLRDHILRHGGHLVAARNQADLVFEPRVGALSIDRKQTLVGIPSFPIPIPLAGDLNFPELALFKRDRQQGVVKLALTSYDARTGELHESMAPVYGFSQHNDWVVLLLFGWQSNDLMPPPDSREWVGEGTFENRRPDVGVWP